MGSFSPFMAGPEATSDRPPRRHHTPTGQAVSGFFRPERDARITSVLEVIREALTAVPVLGEVVVDGRDALIVYVHGVPTRSYEIIVRERAT